MVFWGFGLVVGMLSNWNFFFIVLYCVLNNGLLILKWLMSFGFFLLFKVIFVVDKNKVYGLLEMLFIWIFCRVFFVY